MMRRVKGRRDDLPLTADINVTSLVDVAFTLLVIFIITAPVLQGGIEIDVPEADVQPLMPEDDPFFVSVDAEGVIYLEATPVDPDEFHSSFAQLMAGRQIQRVYVRADSRVPWEQMLQIMATVFAAEISLAAVGVPWEGR